jgi:hypothetical protein
LHRTRPQNVAVYFINILCLQTRQHY